MAFIDISREISTSLPNWPGDTRFSYGLVAKIIDGSSVNVGSFSTSTHTGTHVDAPWHYDDAGLRLHQMDLQIFIGDCLVIDATLAKDLNADLIKGKKPPARVLFKTGQEDIWDAFPKNWKVVNPNLAKALAAQGVKLLGTDAPSVDELTSKDLPGHMALHNAGVFILEGLALEKVLPGEYKLFCLPLKLHAADAAPARVILEKK